jgi:hypothetical protein
VGEARGKASQSSQLAAIAKISESAAHAPQLREHLGDILDSPVFKGSRRSQEFLRYIVENALDGHCDQLKERSLGIELFGRPPSYDTAEDSIVRVSASDVRKRLMQYYAQPRTDPEFRIELPSGSYIPEFCRATAPSSRTEQQAPLAPAATEPGKQAAPRNLGRFLPYGIAAISVAVAVLLGFRNASLERLQGAGSPTAARILPWSAMLDGEHRLNVIFSDTVFGSIQDLMGTSISLSDYANKRFPRPETLAPNISKGVGLLLRRQYTAATDVGIAVRISEVAQTAGRRVTVRSARNLLVQDFRTDDDFVFLGSVRSNPWAELWERQLDFWIEWDSALQKMVCRNKSPRPGEPPVYMPTAGSYATGESYAVLAFLPNPNQSGHILLIAGTTSEGTQIAGQFVTNVDSFGKVLAKAGIDPRGPARPFQVLLRLTAIAGSPGRFEVISFRAGEAGSR